eukprot:5744550-Ditylum_brightwellii.AAC.1
MSLQRNNQHDESALNDISNKLGPDVDIFQGNPSRSVSAQLRLAKKERKDAAAIATNFVKSF